MIKKIKTNTERQKDFKHRMYKAGFKQTIVWVERKEEKQPKKLSFIEFEKKFKKLADGMDEKKLDRLLKTFLKITKAGREVEKIRIKRR
jgi:G:T-mismatch repair DNA endonuclease (very short patch repair protein)